MMSWNIEHNFEDDVFIFSTNYHRIARGLRLEGTSGGPLVEPLLAQAGPPI